MSHRDIKDDSKGKLLRPFAIIVNALCVIFLITILSVAVYLSLKIFLYDTYPVNSHSMYPTIVPGDKILVNKQVFGPRLYRNLDFLDGAPLDTKRIKGLREIMYNDVVVFNHSPESCWSHRVEFSINTVYVKRCIGRPGDSVSIQDGMYHNSSVKDTLGLYKIQLREQHIVLDSGIIGSHPFDHRVPWTIKEFGPLYLPRKGDTIKLTTENIILYKKYIDHETFSETIPDSTGLVIDGLLHDKYVFRDNYYFMAGDNVADSRDSRYLGLVPEEFIVGVATRVALSRDPYTKKFRKDRLFKKL